MFAVYIYCRQWFITAYQGESENVRLFHKEMLNDLEEDAVRVVSSRYEYLFDLMMHG